METGRKGWGGGSISKSTVGRPEKKVVFIFK